MSYFLFIVAFLLGGICTAGVFLAYKQDLKAQIAPAKTIVRRYVFLFKWFLIGKYHCNLPAQQKRVIDVLNKLFWGIVVIALAVLAGDIVEWMG